MLEQPALLLRPGDADGAAPVCRRVTVVDPATGEPLGSARRHGGRGRLAWLRWWEPPLLRVHESDDEPLLMTLRQGWGTRWLVQDADGIVVGRLRRNVLLDRRDQEVAVLRRAPDRAESVYEGPEQRPLAVTAAVAGGVRLTFLPEAPDSPFLRMVLLAAALVHNEDILMP